MAGANNARQKMINLMYLVFIAMLAMQIDQEVLNNFLDIDKSLESSKVLTEQNSKLFYENLAQKAKNAQAKFGYLNQKAQVVKKKSDELVSFIETIKTDLATKADFDVNNPEKSGYALLKQTDQVHEVFFPKDIESQTSKDLVSNITNYRDYVTKTFGTDTLKAQFSSVLQRTSKALALESTGKGPDKKRWSLRKFGGQTPLVAALSTLTQLQSDIRAIESETVTKMLAEKIDSEISMNAFKAIVNAPTAMFVGDGSKATVALGSYDNTADIKVTVNGNNVPVKNGQAELSLGGGVGKKSISGTVMLKNIKTGEYDKFPFKHEYEIFAKSTGGVIAAKKMKVVYIGVDNPIEGDLSGAKAGTLKMSGASGLRKTGNKEWSIRPTGGRSVTLKLTGAGTDGSTKSVTETFRVKSIPKPVGTMQGKTSPKMPASSLARQTLRAEIPDFDFDVNPTVTSFVIKVAGRPSIRVNGNKLNAQAKGAVSRLRSGDVVIINNIKAKANGIKLKEVSPVNVEIQ